MHEIIAMYIRSITVKARTQMIRQTLSENEDEVAVVTEPDDTDTDDTDTDTEIQLWPDIPNADDCMIDLEEVIYPGISDLVRIAINEHRNEIVGYSTRKNVMTSVPYSENFSKNWVSLVKLEQSGFDRLFVCGQEVFVAGYNDYMLATKENIITFIARISKMQYAVAMIVKLERMLELWE